MISHSTLTTQDLHRAIRNKKIVFGGNARLKIYGLLTCKSGKRMNMANRVFFDGLMDAVDHGYRPCAHCLPAEYRRWKSEQETGSFEVFR